MEEGTIRASTYVRVSSDEQVRGYSLGEQRRLAEERIEAEGWTLAKVYEDAGISGAGADRPAYQALLVDASDGALDVLLVWKLDRLGRDAEELLRARRMFGAAGVRLISLTEGEEESNLVYGVRAIVAQEERERIAERVRVGMAARARAGKLNGGPRPFGYSYADGELVVVRDEAEVVKRIYSQFIGGQSQRAISRDLNREGVPALRSTWHQGTVSRILANPLYWGRIRLNGEVLPGAHDPLVDDATWDAAARLREATARTKGAGRGRPSSGSHLFGRGMLRCHCGAAMVPRTIKPRSKTGKPGEWYLCYDRIRDSAACSQTPVDREAIDSAAFGYFESVGLDLWETREQFAQEHLRRLAEASALRERAERDLIRAEADLEKLDADYFAGELGAANYERLRASRGEGRDALTAEVDRLRQREREVAADEIPADADEMFAWLAELRAAIAGRIRDAEGLEAVRAALLSMFDGFTLHRADSEAGPVWTDLEVGEFFLEPHVRPDVVLLEPVVVPDASDFGTPDGRFTLAEAKKLGVTGRLEFEYRQVPLRRRGNNDSVGRSR
jgi:site-specific DNA recombinase